MNWTELLMGQSSCHWTELLMGVGPHHSLTISPPQMTTTRLVSFADVELSEATKTSLQGRKAGITRDSVPYRIIT